MAILSISEYDFLARDENYGTAASFCDDPELVYQELAVGASSVQSAAFSGASSILRLQSDVPLRYIVALNPTAAVGTSKRLPANVVEWIGIEPGYKLACITSA